MGTVYLADDTEPSVKVALKLLPTELAQDERFRQRFLRESKLAARLDHPHIVPILGSGDENGVLYLAMAYVDGMGSPSAAPAARAVSSRSERSGSSTR